MRVVSGKHKGRLLKMPRHSQTRPITGAAKERLFAILLAQIDGAIVVDLYAGSGAIGIEALSRGSIHVTFVEVNHSACECIKLNIGSLDENASTTIIEEEVETFLKRSKCQFDVVFAAPPYTEFFYIDFLNAMNLAYDLISNNGVIVLESNKKCISNVHLSNLTLEKELFCRDTVFQFWTPK